MNAKLEETLAYSSDRFIGRFGAITLNRNKSQQTESLKKDLKRKLLSIKSPETGRRVIDEVWFKEDLYSGPNLEKAPDIIFRTFEKWMPVRMKGNSTFGEFYPGKLDDHRMNGIFLAYGPDIKSTGEELEGLNITDIAPTILHLMNCPVPEDMDGRVLKEIFKKDSDPARRKIKYIKSFKKKHKKKLKMSAKQTEGIKKRLKELGYL